MRTTVSLDRQLAAHEIDLSLLRRAERITKRGTTNPVLRFGLVKLVDDYRTACRLAQGPIRERSEHWTVKAKALWHELDSQVWRLE